MWAISDNGVAAEYLTPLWGEGVEIVVKRGGEQVGVLIADTRNERRFLNDAPPTCARLGEARQRPVANPMPRAGRGPIDFGEQRSVGCGGAKPINVESIVGSGEQRLLRQPSDVLAICGRQLRDRSGALLFGELVLSAGHPHAGGKATQVPFPATRVRFIEIVEVDHQVLLGRGVEAEVAEMSVAANDRLDASGGQPGEVFGHDHRGAAQVAIR